MVKIIFKKQLVLLFVLISAFSFSQKSEFLFGQLVDSTQNEPVSFATIQIQGKALGVISNVDGTFKFPKKFSDLGEVLEISCLGFETKELEIKEFIESQSNIIILKPGAFELTEAVVSANIKRLSARQIVRIAVNNIPQNYPQNDFGLVGYYRDYQVKNGAYTNLNEAIIKVLDEGFGKKNSLYNQYQLLSYSENKDFEIDSFAKQSYDYKGFNKIIPYAKMKNDGGNEFIILAMHDALRNYKEESYSFIDKMDSDFVEKHKFRLKGTSNYKKESVYEINFTFRNEEYTAEGKIFINKDDFAIHKLDYAVDRRKKPNDVSIAINDKERFSDGFKKMNNEMLYHIQTEYTRGDDKKMMLNYISFYNKILIQRPAVFKSKVVILLNDRSIRIPMNSVPMNLRKIKNRDFKILYKNELFPIKEFYFLEDERTFVVCPDLKYERVKHLFEDSFNEGEGRNLQVLNFKYSFGEIRDSLGNKLNERKWEYLHQYREFFTQETKLKSEMIDENNLMVKTLPLDSPQQPITNAAAKDMYWKNTPLPSLNN